SSNSDSRCGISAVQSRVNAFEKLTYTCTAFFFGSGRRAVIQFAQIAARRKYGLSCAGNDANRSFWNERAKRGDKLFQLCNHGRTNFIGGLMIQRQLDDSLSPFQRNVLPVKLFMHAAC